MANKVTTEDLERVKMEASILSEEDIREMAKEKLHTYAGIHHFNEKKITEETSAETLDENVA